MRVFHFALCIISVCLIGFARAGDDLDLDESTFQDTIDNNDFVLVMFYAPWCGHCKNFKPHFAAAATKAKGKYVLAKVDCTLDNAKQLCQDHEVRGYPTVKFFKKGIPVDYSGPRDTEGVIAWLDKKTGPAAVTIAAGEVDKFVADANGNPVVIGFFAETGDKEHEEFLQAANDARLEEFRFAQVVGSGVEDGTVRLYVAASKEPLAHPGKVEDDKALADWLFENSFPLLDEVGGHNFNKYVQRGKPLHLVFIEPTDPNLEQLKKDLTTVAAEHRDESFSWIDAQKYKQNIKGMGASGDVVPVIIRLANLADQSQSKPIVFEEPLNLESLRKWAEGVKSGVYKYVPKSEPVPESNDGPVKVVVGKTWDTIVGDASKNVLVEFYAPWCGHCKNLAPKYEELGQKFANSPDFVISKIDGTANDVTAHFEVRGFPTLLLYRKDAKQAPIAYEGPREVADMEKWLLEHK